MGTKGIMNAKSRMSRYSSIVALAVMCFFVLVAGFNVIGAFNRQYLLDLLDDTPILAPSNGTNVSGTISSDTLWKIKGSPYRIVDDTLPQRVLN
ncbi:MAG: hypothetical protein ABH950_01870 [Candidatus Altiarchaeota archaeon]